MPNLILKLKNESLGDYPLQKGISLTIGRRKKNNLSIEDKAVSGHHAKIESVGDSFVLIDLQSKNGSFVNEQLINSHWLKDGDTINIGEHSLLFNYSEDDCVSEENTDELEKTIVLDTNQYRNRMRKSNPTRSIINVAGFWDKGRNQNRKMGQQRSIPMGPTNVKKDLIGMLTYLAGGRGEVNLDQKYTTIGKHPASNIIIRGIFMGQTAVTISKLPDSFQLSYVSGITKPRVNDKIIKQSIILKNEDIIAIGSTKLQFIDGKTAEN
ncbi:MAG: FHA domain-containing protein [bacterium]|nr:FHA domain-containing protein [bacterium]